MHQAAERGDDQMIKLLLEFGADRNLTSGWNGATQPSVRGRILALARLPNWKDLDELSLRELDHPKSNTGNA